MRRAVSAIAELLVEVSLMGHVAWNDTKSCDDADNDRIVFIIIIILYCETNVSAIF